MKKAIVLFIIVILNFILTTPLFAEWRIGEKVYLGNTVNSIVNYSFAYCEKIDKIYTCGFSESWSPIIYDPETLTGVGELPYDYHTHPTGNIVIDNEKDILYVLSANKISAFNSLSVDF